MSLTTFPFRRHNVEFTYDVVPWPHNYVPREHQGRLQSGETTTWRFQSVAGSVLSCFMTLNRKSNVVCWLIACSRDWTRLRATTVPKDFASAWTAQFTEKDKPRTEKLTATEKQDNLSAAHHGHVRAKCSWTRARLRCQERTLKLDSTSRARTRAARPCCCRHVGSQLNHP